MAAKTGWPANCQGGKPAIVGGSELAGLDATSLSTPPTGFEQHVNLGGIVFLNEAVQGTNSSTFRALRVVTPVGDIVAGESQAGFTGNPC